MATKEEIKQAKLKMVQDAIAQVRGMKDDSQKPKKAKKKPAVPTETEKQEKDPGAEPVL